MASSSKDEVSTAKNLVLYRFVAADSNSNTKLETIFRMANIPYDLGSGNPFIAPKGKLPYVKFANGEKMGDSNLIYKHLIANKVIQDLDTKLSSIERLHSESFRIFIEEWAHWLRLWDLWIVNFPKARSYIFSEGGLTSYPGQVVLGWLTYRKNKKNNYIQGFGRHSDEDIKQFIVEAVAMMATFVREEKRFADIERPCLVQATLFGFLLSIYRVRQVSTIWISEMEKFPELEAWTRNMTSKYYPERTFP